MSIRGAAKKFGLCHVSLMRYKKKVESGNIENISMGYKSCNRIFSAEQEKQMTQYIIKAAFTMVARRKRLENWLMILVSIIN